MPIPHTPGEDDTRDMAEYIFNKELLLTRKSAVSFKYAEGLAKMGSVKAAKSKKFLVIQITKDHLYGQKDFETMEFVVFKTDDNKLHKSKVTLNVEKNVEHDFDISDEV